MRRCDRCRGTIIGESCINCGFDPSAAQAKADAEKLVSGRFVRHPKTRLTVSDEVSLKYLKMLMKEAR